ncbi:MAG: hypothetical protein FJ288_18520 [Planctomycetes bacterium]|nr:hypothetical protein [Planctomycetota bacterium]
MTQKTARRLAAAARAAVFLAAWMAAAVAARADSKVLEGVPAYLAADVFSAPAAPQAPPGLAAVCFAASDPLPALRGPTLPAMPQYEWWYGCSPTAAGMMAGYWDGLPGRTNLFDGDARIWFGDQDTGTRAMVASRAHITAGKENGYTYGDYHNSISYPEHQANPDCVADFLKTVDSGTYASNIAAGLRNFIAWDNPRTALPEGLPAQTAQLYVPFFGGTFEYDTFKAEIDAGRPVILNLLTAETETKWVGHSVVGYGYQDAMFQVKVATNYGAILDLTVGGFAVRDTWMNGTAFSEWVDWKENVFSSVIDAQGVEWWPFIDIRGASWVYDDGTPGPYDWMVTDAVTLYVAPEPATALLVAAGMGWLARRTFSRGRHGRGRRPAGDG